MAILLIITCIPLLLICFFLINFIMKKSIFKIASLHAMLFFVSSIVALALMVIVIGSLLPTKEPAAKQGESRERVAMELKDGNEKKYARYFIDEEELTIIGDTLWINKEEQDEMPDYYVQRGDFSGQIIKVRHYLLPAVIHGYEMNQPNIKNNIVFTEHKNLQIVTPNKEVIKEEFKVFNSDLRINDFERLEAEHYDVQQLTIIEIPKNMKVYFETDLSLGGI